MIKKEKVPEFRINEYLTLKLEEDGKTFIYVAGKLFRQCKYLLINIPVDKARYFIPNRNRYNNSRLSYYSHICMKTAMCIEVNVLNN